VRSKAIVHPKARAAAWVLLLVAGLASSPATAINPAGAADPSPAPAPAERSWTIDDIVRMESANGATLSRDGRSAAWIRSTVETVDGVEQRVGNLWLNRLGEPARGQLGDAEPAKPEPLQLTRGRNGMSSPAFSPDGTRIAFLTDRKVPGEEGAKKVEGAQVWMIPTGGGEAYPVTAFDRAVRAFGWIDGETLVVLAPESKSAWELELETRHDEARVVDDAFHEAPARLYRVAAEPGGTVHRLTTNDDWIDSLAVSPDGRWAVITAQQSLSYEFDGKVPPQTRLVDLETGTSRRLFEEPVEGRTLLPHSVAWQPDSAGFYFVDEYTTHPFYRTATVSHLFHHDLATSETERVDLDSEPGLGRGYATIPGGVVTLLADGVYERLARFDRTGGSWVKTEIGRQDGGTSHVRTMDSLVASADGKTLLYQHSTATEPFQLYAARLDADGLGKPVQVTDLNSGFADKPTGRVDVIHFTGARGNRVEALLHYPLDWTESTEPRPLILDIHGGPTARDRQAWDQRWPAPSVLWRERGAFVLQVNYHGSTGYGLEWVESIGGGHYYELEIPDLEAGVDWAIDQGLADPERLASVGWSNGGILTAELITRTTRYKAASVGAADVEWISDWANVDFGASFDNYYFGGPPWEIPEAYIEKSPFFRLTEVTTPTIIYTGTEDRNVPPHQSWSLFRVLQQLGKTETKLVLFPGEPHGLRKLADQRRKMQEDLTWLGRFLFETHTEPVEAIRAGTLIEALVERAGAARVEGVLGRDENGVPIPETARFAGQEVGRFEVTRAQWAAFDPAAKVAPGEADLPVTGVGLERAKAYTAWLAERTGRPFRLPTVEEAKKLAKAGGSGGNTLDRWAGYAPNPADAAAIRKALSEKVSGEAPLLLPVGSLPGKKGGDAGEVVFDLDGNAAEWAAGEGGAGEPVGPSADRSTDPRGDGGKPAPEYVGLRVVVSG